MFKRTRCNIIIGICIFVAVIVTILIVKFHHKIRFDDDYLLTPKFDLSTKFNANNANNANCKNQFGINFKSFLQQVICPAKDFYIDLHDAIEYMESKESHNTETDAKLKETETLADFFNFGPMENLTVLDKFNLEIKQTELYAENSSLVGELLHEMKTRKIIRVEEKSGGTQLKFKIIYDNGMYALAKPMRFSREMEIALPNQMQYAEFERHTAEIAAYHLDRLLGFRRTMPVIGRILNVTSEIYEIAHNNLSDTFFESDGPEKNQCFYGTCSQYCDKFHAFCANKDLLEAAFIGFLPTYFDVKIKEYENPWKKSYDRKRKAIWQHDPQYCEKVKRRNEFKSGPRLLYLIDLIIFDFLTGNKDRHSYEMFGPFHDPNFLINFDNGRAFGHPYYDEELNLIPLAQCCIIRSSTLKTLLRFHNGPKPLSQLMRESLASDPIAANAPVLIEPHLEALDRRVDIILRTYRECIENNLVDDVIFSGDNFEYKSESTTSDVSDW
ncbi:extracellular serine/threonine protein CG31145-like [Contarinia nasturtii]|uniref:extracellular serine/threonine protein CG31145-like n=1 Tax=Contarinia nasturtii TaxID=265458 RepID=UPI0012D3F002|nr:extracellular serine/threonine protein CG31145-like [Contarinia nasturtii]